MQGCVMLSEVYKYQKIDEFTKDALRNKYLYFAKPSQLNDPFDCRIRAYWEGSQAEKEHWLSYVGIEKTKNAELLLNHKGRMNSTDFDPKLVERTNDVIRILSLSATPSSVPMWSHYAKNHEGICLKLAVKTFDGDEGLKFRAFNFTKRSSVRHPPGFLRFTALSYTKDLPNAINMLTSKGRDFNPFVFTKHEDWAYERELRIMIYETLSGGEQRIKYGDNLVVAIIFGAKTKKVDQKEVEGIAKKSFGSDIRFYRAIKHDEEYSMRIVDI